MRWVVGGLGLATGHVRTLFRCDPGAVADAVVAPYNMARFASTTVKIDTGFEVDTIQYISVSVRLRAAARSYSAQVSAAMARGLHGLWGW